MKNLIKLLLSVIIFFGVAPVGGTLLANTCEAVCCQVAYTDNDSDSEEIKKKKKKKGKLKKEKGKKKKGKFFSKLFGSK